MNFQTKFPELNENQRKMLEREIAERERQAVIDELERIIKGQPVTSFTKYIQARANELKLEAEL